MANYLTLVRMSDTSGPRHGGTRVYRHFQLWLNRVMLDEFHDDNPDTRYDSGEQLDLRINARISLLESALCCKVERVHPPESTVLMLWAK